MTWQFLRQRQRLLQASGGFLKGRVSTAIIGLGCEVSARTGWWRQETVRVPTIPSSLWSNTAQ
jgi:hypothetical protein